MITLLITIFVILNIYRNRLAAERKFRLPVNEDATIADFRVTERAAEWMISHKTTELPPQFVKRVIGHNYMGQRQYLECEGFVLESRFPDNIAVLNDGTVMYCTGFREPDDTLGPFSIVGMKFLDVKPMFRVPMDSSRIGLYTVRHLNMVKPDVVSSDELASKCFIWAHPRADGPQDFEVDPLPECLHKTLRKSHDRFADEAKAFKSSEEGVLHQSLSTWDVLSIEVPGRHVL